MLESTVLLYPSSAMMHSQQQQQQFDNAESCKNKTKKKGIVAQTFFHSTICDGRNCEVEFVKNSFFENGKASDSFRLTRVFKKTCTAAFRGCQASCCLTTTGGVVLISVDLEMCTSMDECKELMLLLTARVKRIQH